MPPLFFLQENVPDSKPCALGSYLGMVYPWYECTISSLGLMIPSLASTVLMSCYQLYHTLMSDHVLGPTGNSTGFTDSQRH